MSMLLPQYWPSEEELKDAYMVFKKCEAEYLPLKNRERGERSDAHMELMERKLKEKYLKAKRALFDCDMYAVRIWDEATIRQWKLEWDREMRRAADGEGGETTPSAGQDGSSDQTKGEHPSHQPAATPTHQIKTSQTDCGHLPHSKLGQTSRSDMSDEGQPASRPSNVPQNNSQRFNEVERRVTRVMDEGASPRSLAVPGSFVQKTSVSGEAKAEKLIATQSDAPRIQKQTEQDAVISSKSPGSTEIEQTNPAERQSKGSELENNKPHLHSGFSRTIKATAKKCCQFFMIFPVIMAIICYLLWPASQQQRPTSYSELATNYTRSLDAQIPHANMTMQTWALGICSLDHTRYLLSPGALIEDQFRRHQKADKGHCPEKPAGFLRKEDDLSYMLNWDQQRRIDAPARGLEATILKQAEEMDEIWQSYRRFLGLLISSTSTSSPSTWKDDGPWTISCIMSDILHIRLTKALREREMKRSRAKQQLHTLSRAAMELETQEQALRDLQALCLENVKALKDMLNSFGFDWRSSQILSTYLLHRFPQVCSGTTPEVLAVRPPTFANITEFRQGFETMSASLHRIGWKEDNPLYLGNARIDEIKTVRWRIANEVTSLLGKWGGVLGGHTEDGK
ncbi:Hypothetical predicted protein [Lecanosticta acicola]|uniref:Uncharacterized protein n=1 Tax=Lecanosticta acicola TaxID=111012 RepID=A0AAI9EE10_9PEZI|nr:Hypothetical predicted protein [Lecanosticta acicola]